MPLTIKSTQYEAFALLLNFMEVNRETIEKLARLSRLHFSEEEKMEIQADLQKMIHFVDKLNELDTAGLEPVLHMSAEKNMLREDVVEGSVTAEEALYNAPEKHQSFFTVPKVIRK
ncbi:MAG: Asp-tRNA(Asn)/Glu-tRNA(Gln) amidotransferase subunit GatC [Chitinophagaceae bacterium]